VNLGRFKEALDIFGVVLKEYGDQESWRQKTEYEVAAAYIQLGHEDEGLKRMADFITRYPDAPLTPQVIFWLGEAYKRRADFVSAHKYFERLIRHYPHQALGVDAYMENGLAYAEEGSWEAALRHFEQVEQRGAEAEACRAAVLSGDIYLKRDRPDQAMEAYRRASAKPSVWKKVALAKMARLERENKDLKEAASLFRQALKEEGLEMNAGLQFELAEVLQESGATDDAIEAYTKVHYLYPEEKEMSVKALLRMAQLYEDDGNISELRSILEKVASLDVPEARYASDKLAGLDPRTPENKGGR
jgi:TolA-binding protein